MRSQGTHNTVANPIRVVAKNGQITLGKKFAGKQIQIFEEDDNTVIIKTIVALPRFWLGVIYA